MFPLLYQTKDKGLIFTHLFAQPPTNDSKKAWNAFLRQLAVMHKLTVICEALQHEKKEIAQSNRRPR